MPSNQAQWVDFGEFNLYCFRLEDLNPDRGLRAGSSISNDRRLLQLLRCYGYTENLWQKRQFLLGGRFRCRSRG